MATVDSLEDIVKFAIKNATAQDIAGSDIAEVKALAEDMCSHLQSGIESSSAAPLNPTITISNTEPDLTSVSTSNGKGMAYFEFEIQADGNLERDSLQGNKHISTWFPNGGIIKLLDQGYSIKNVDDAKRVRGEWNGAIVGPRLARSGAGFLDEFKQTYSSGDTEVEVLI